MSRRDQEDRETGQTVSQKNLILAENAQGTEQRAALDNCLPNVWQQLAKARGWCFDFQMCSIYTCNGIFRSHGEEGNYVVCQESRSNRGNSAK